MADRHVILESYGIGLVAAHSRSDLSLPFRIRSGFLFFVVCESQFFLQCFHRLLEIAFAFATLSRFLGTCRDMDDTATVLMLVPVLPAFALAGKPLDLEFRIVFGFWFRRYGRKDGNGHCAAVHATSFFIWRNPLNTMSTSFVFKSFGTIARHFEHEAPVAAVGFYRLSALSERKFLIGAKKLRCEMEAVVSAFRRSDFYFRFHGNGIHLANWRGARNSNPYFRCWRPTF